MPNACCRRCFDSLISARGAWRGARGGSSADARVHCDAHPGDRRCGRCSASCIARPEKWPTKGRGQQMVEGAPRWRKATGCCSCIQRPRWRQVGKRKRNPSLTRRSWNGPAPWCSASRWRISAGEARRAEVQGAIWCARRHCSALPYGDQGLLIPKRLYVKLGGYRALANMEDADLVRLHRPAAAGVACAIACRQCRAPATKRLGAALALDAVCTRAARSV